jgi:WhiB family redox-sensing transcriptional regulator
MSDLPDLDTIVADRSASWRHRAACRGMPDLFFPAGYTDPVPVARAKAVCATCPVARPCRDEADIDGIWGGTTPRERGVRWGGRQARARRSEAPAVAAGADAQIDEAIERMGWAVPAPVVEVVLAAAPTVAPAIDQALRTLARHHQVALRARTDVTAGVISRQVGRKLRDDGLIVRDRTIPLTGPCWALTASGRDLATQLHLQPQESP